MYRPSRVRRVAKWLGLVATAAVLVGWGLSAKYTVMKPVAGRTFIAVLPGLFQFGVLDEPWTGPTVEEMLFLGAESYRLAFKFSLRLPLIVSTPVGAATKTGFRVDLPFLFLLLMTAGPTAWLWRRDRRPIIETWCCRACGYKLYGNRSGKCSECGAMVRPADSTK